MKIFSAQLKGTTTLAADAVITLTSGSFTGSFSGSVYGINEGIEQFSTSVDSRLDALETDTGSQSAKLSALESFTSSANTRLTNLENKTGSLATTGSNTFFGTQTFSGSVYIANDLVVQGSSSIQYITGSSVNIGTNIVQLNTANPSVRYAGLSIVDSGSVGGSGSFLYDSVQDEFIFVHRGDGTNVTSSHFVLGPETYNDLGNETYITCNRITKGTGKEHIVNSNIFDDGTTICLSGNTIGTGTMCIGGNTTFSNCVGIGTLTPGAKLEIQSPRNSTLLRLTATSGENWDFKNCNIVGSTDILSIGANGATANLNLKDDGSIGIGIDNPETLLHLNKATAGGEGPFIFLDNSASSTLGNKAGIRFATNAGATFAGYGSFIEAVNTNASNGAESLTFGTWDGGARAERLRISSNGVTCFSNTICAPATYLGDCASIGATTYDFGFEVFSTKNAAITSNNTFSANFNLIFNRNNVGSNRNCFNILADQNAAYLRTLTCNPITFVTNSQERMTIASGGHITFSCQIQTNGACIIVNRGDGNPGVLQLGNTSNAYQIQFTCTGGQRIAFVNGAPTEYASFFGTGIACFSSTVCAGNGLIVSSSRTCGDLGIVNGNGYGWIYAQDANHSIIIRGNRAGTAADYTNYYQYGGNLSTGKGHLFWTGGVLSSQTLKMQIADDGIQVSVNFAPSANNTYCLGTSSCAWAHIYTNDLHLSNMSKCGGNDIDGTNGNWTIQEGAENLYIINNMNCKRFRIKLEEII